MNSPRQRQGRSKVGGTLACLIRLRGFGFCVVLSAALAPFPLPLPRGALAEPFANPERVISGFEEGVRFQVPRGVTLDPLRGEFIVANTGAHRLEIFSVSGRPLGRFVHRVRRADGTWSDGLPHAVGILPTGEIAVADRLSPAIDLLNRRGKSVGSVALSFAVPGSPSALCVMPSGELLAAGPPGDDHVYRISQALAVTGTWGRSGTAPGELSAVTGLAVLPNGNIVVSCAKTDLAVQIFSPGGEYRTGFGRHDIGHGNFSLPSGVATTVDGRIWVADELRQTVQVFDKEGLYLGMFGGKGLAAGDFHYPSALASDGRSRLAVAEREAGRVQLLTVCGGGDATLPTSPDLK